MSYYIIFSPFIKRLSGCRCPGTENSLYLKGRPGTGKSAAGGLPAGAGYAILLKEIECRTGYLFPPQARRDTDIDIG